MAKKLFYKIGEACKILDVKPFVLRYWETEFPFLKPEKSKSGQRIYSERDLDMIRRIDELLNVEGYTIAGARKKLKADLEAGLVPEQGAADKPKESAASKSAASKSAASKSATATGATANSDTQADSQPVVDTEAREKIEKLRSGIEEGLRQVGEVLELLGESAA